MARVDELRALAARMATAGGKRIAVTPASAHTVAHALRAYADQLERPREEHPNFTVDVWDTEGHLIETLAHLWHVPPSTRRYWSGSVTK